MSEMTPWQRYQATKTREKHRMKAALRLAGLNRAFDLAPFKERSARMYRDVDRTIGVFTHLVSKGDPHFGVKVGCRVGHRHVPLLRHRGGGP